MSKLGIVLASICLLDLTGTALGIHLGYFGEANPILNYFLERWGLPGLIYSKVFFTAVPISFLEIILKLNLVNRRRMEIFYKITIWVYVSVFVGSIAFQLIAAY